MRHTLLATGFPAGPVTLAATLPWPPAPFDLTVTSWSLPTVISAVTQTAERAADLKTHSNNPTPLNQLMGHTINGTTCKLTKIKLSYYELYINIKEQKKKTSVFL